MRVTVSSCVFSQHMTDPTGNRSCSTKTSLPTWYINVSCWTMCSGNMNDYLWRDQLPPDLWLGCCANDGCHRIREYRFLLVKVNTVFCWSKSCCVKIPSSRNFLIWWRPFTSSGSCYRWRGELVTVQRYENDGKWCCKKGTSLRGFHTVGGSVPKKHVGMYRYVVNINFCIMLKGLKVNVKTENPPSPTSLLL
jgi:hypothetical protein